MALPDQLKDFGRAPLRWIKAHKILSVGLLILLWILTEIATLPYGAVGRLKKSNPSETALMKERGDQERGQGKAFTIRQRWVSLGSISKDLVKAVIVAEDGTFWSHEGFDWYEFRESVERDIKEGRAARGASTITQQLVKNVFLSSSKNPLRKLKEWILTWYMERVLSKSRILELYLNVIEWGNGIYGAEAASVYYFGEPASELSREEAARLAAIIPSPRRFRADEDTRFVTRRSNLILERMAARGY
jgi:monofunctional biosynthetic peptidoglycan transglycosylase